MPVIGALAMDWKGFLPVVEMTRVLNFAPWREKIRIRDRLWLWLD